MVGWPGGWAWVRTEDWAEVGRRRGWAEGSGGRVGCGVAGEEGWGRGGKGGVGRGANDRCAAKQNGSNMKAKHL